MNARHSTSLKIGIAIGAVLVSQSAFAQSAASNYTTGYRFDLIGRMTGAISPDPDGSGPLHYAATRNTYDAAGHLTEVDKGELSAWQSETVAPSSWTGFTIYFKTVSTYDNLGRKTQDAIYGSDGSQVAATQYSYDFGDRAQCTTVRMNTATFGSLPADPCTLGTQGSQGPDRITKNIYDAAGELIQVRKAVGTSIEQAYATYSYTPNGKQQYVIDANGNRALLAYDGFDRELSWTFPSLTAPTSYNPATQATALSSAGSVNSADYEQYGYDADDNRTSLRKRDGSTLTYSYDALSRMTVKIVPERSGLATTDTRDVYYGYDAWGRQTYARFDSASGEGISNVYDGFGRQTSTTQAIDGTSRAVSFLYDNDSDRTRVTQPDGNYTQYSYDGLDRPFLIQRSGSTTIASYSYDPFGRRISFNSSGINTSYTYDKASRLATLSNAVASNAGYNLTISGSGACRDIINNPAVCYNAASQITELSRSNSSFLFTAGYNVNRGYTANGLNQYSSAGTSNFTYDGDGDLTSDGSSTFTYDVENRLVAATGAHSATLRYDPLGRLYEVAGSSGTTRFLYAGGDLLGEYNTAGTLLRRYVHGADGQADDPIAWYEGSTFTASSERLMRPDWNGSIILVTDSVGSTVIAANAYDEYGIPQPTDVGRFQYTGQVWIPELGMNYYKARMYSPTLGRFLQTDPIGYSDQIDLYEYVFDDPLNKQDPSGDCAEDFCIIEGGVALAAASDAIFGTTIVASGAALLHNIASHMAADDGGASSGSSPGIGHNGGPSMGDGGPDGPKRGSLVVPGPYAGDSVPAHPGRPTAAERRKIDQIGRDTGCHSCGTKESGMQSGHFVGDHQPPTKLNPPGGQQQYFPHCLSCSQAQGGAVSHMPPASPTEPPPPPPLKEQFE